MYLGYRTIQLWCCVSCFGIFFVVAGKWFWREISRFFVEAKKFYYDRKKKVPAFCLAGCAVVSVFGSGDYDRKKKVLVVNIEFVLVKLELKLIQIR